MSRRREPRMTRPEGLFSFLPGRLRDERGFTLIELLISLVTGRRGSLIRSMPASSAARPC
jgi:type II secretory pathway component PulJ